MEISSVTVPDDSIDNDVHFRDAANDLWASDNLQIDEDATVSVGEGGFWVQAWVWVSDLQVNVPSSIEKRD